MRNGKLQKYRTSDNNVEFFKQKRGLKPVPVYGTFKEKISEDSPTPELVRVSEGLMVLRLLK